MAKFDLHVNGQTRAVDVAPDTPLLWVLRDTLNLVGTKFGCGIGQCGACTVHLDGQPGRACLTPVSAAATMKVVTIEGLAAEFGSVAPGSGGAGSGAASSLAAGAHPVQAAWCELDVAQCGYCQAGQIMSAAALLREKPHPTDAEIDDAMAGNLCRCATYYRIRKGIHRAAELAAGARPDPIAQRGGATPDHRDRTELIEAGAREAVS
jgi:aerobic-type carbon monoxide dehydrogenase small subunit (CoxS/CutS family)